MHPLSNNGSQRMARIRMSVAAIAGKGAVHRFAPRSFVWRGKSTRRVTNVWQGRGAAVKKGNTMPRWMGLRMRMAASMSTFHGWR